MGMPITESYDLLAMITEKGLQRLLQAAYLEHWAPLGLPRPLSLGNDLLRFHFHLELPSVVIRPLGFSDDYILQNGINAIGITFPFRDSAIIGNSPRYCLNGNMTIALPIVSAGRLAIDTTNADVRLDFAVDDPDPNDGDLTSAQKIPPDVQGGSPDFYATLIGAGLRSEPPDEFTTVLTNPILDIFQGLDACPVDAAGGGPPTLPVVRVPDFLRPRCATVEERDDALVIRAKASALAVAAGTAGDATSANVSWFDEDMDFGVMIANRLILQELLPASLLPPLMNIDTVPIQAAAEAQVDAEIAAEEAADEDLEVSDRERGRRVRAAFDAGLAAAVGTAFAFPMSQTAALPMTIPLPTIGDMIVNGDEAVPVEQTAPNASLTSMTTSIVPGGAANSVIRLTMNLTIVSPDPMTAVLAVDLVAGHRHGEFVLSIDVNNVDITLPGVPDNVFPLLTIYIIDPLINALADAFGEPAAAAVVEDELQSRFSTRDISRRLRPLMLVRRTRMDDLEIQGDFRIAHDAEGTLRSGAPVIERASLQRQRTFFSPSAETQTLRFTDDGPGAATVDDNAVTPLTGFRAALLGYKRLFAARNLGQVDARRPSLNWGTDPITLPPIDTLTDLDVESRVVAVALRGPNGQRAVVIAWNNLVGALNVTMRVYRQIGREMYIILRPYAQPFPSDADVQGYDPSFRATYLDMHTAHLNPSNCAATAQSWSEGIDVPHFVGGAAGAVLGTVKVGVAHSVCQLEATAVAVAILAREPRSDIHWKVIRSDGSEIDLLAGAAQTVDVDPGTGQDEQHNITFQIDPERSFFCRFRGEEGKDAKFSLRASMTEKYDAVMSADFGIDFTGEHYDAFGFDRWLDIFEKTGAMLAKDLLGDPLGPVIQWADAVFGHAGRPSRGDPADPGVGVVTGLRPGVSGAEMLLHCARSETGLLGRHVTHACAGRSAGLVRGADRARRRLAEDLRGADAVDSVRAWIKAARQTAPDDVLADARFKTLFERADEAARKLPTPAKLIARARDAGRIIGKGEARGDRRGGQSGRRRGDDSQ